MYWLSSHSCFSSLTFPSLPKLKGIMDVSHPSSLTLTLMAASPPVCHLCPWHSLVTEGEWILPLFTGPLRASFQSSTLLTNAKRHAEPRLQPPLWTGAALSAQPPPGQTTNPDLLLWLKELTLGLGWGQSQTLLWDRFFFSFLLNVSLLRV